MQPNWNSPPPVPGPAYPVPGHPSAPGQPAIPGPLPAPQYPAGAWPGPGMPPMPPRPRRGVFKTLLIVFGCLAVALGGLLAIGFVFTVPVESRPLTETERARMLTAEEVASWADVEEPARVHETTKYEKYLDGAQLYSYEYEKPELFYVNCDLHIDKSAADAKVSFNAIKAGASIGEGLAGDGIQFEKRNDVFQWGDESDFYVMRRPDGAVGNFIVVRKGQKVAQISFSGVYVDDAETARDNLLPVMERLFR